MVRTSNIADVNVKIRAPGPILAAVAVALSACARPDEPAEAPPAPNEAALPSVQAAVETRPVDLAGDIADDPAIWIHPTNPSASRIIGTAKQAGIYVYDLEGNVVQRLEGGRMNNVDVRYRFPLRGREVDLVLASEQTRNAIAIYAVDPESGRLTDIADGLQPSGLPSISGLCMYHSRRSGSFYAFASDASGLIRQWQLFEAGEGVAVRPVRDFLVGSQAEGCAADDELGALYVAEEDVALWRYDAEPGGGDQRRLVAAVASLSALRDDLEGVAIYYGANGAGHLIVSSQGNDSYAVFDREGENPYLGSFVVAADTASGIDGTAETDGVDVISTPLGPNFPTGLFVAQDGRNLMPEENQNFKLVRWSEIAGALGLGTFTDRDPRDP